MNLQWQSKVGERLLGVNDRQNVRSRSCARLLEVTRLAVAEDDPALAIQRRIFAGASPTDDVAILTARFTLPDGAARLASIGALQFNRLELAAPDGLGSVAGQTPLEPQSQRADDLDARLRELLAPG